MLAGIRNQLFQLVNHSLVVFRLLNKIDAPHVLLVFAEALHQCIQWLARHRRFSNVALARLLLSETSR